MHPVHPLPIVSDTVERESQLSVWAYAGAINHIIASMINLPQLQPTPAPMAEL